MVPAPKPPKELDDRHLLNALKYTSARLDALELEAARRDLDPTATTYTRKPKKKRCSRCMGSGLKHPENTGKQFNCWDCKLVHDSFMVKNEVWKQAMPEYVEEKRKLKSMYGLDRPFLVTIHLCFYCLEKRLGRHLRPEDFNLLLPINHGIALGMAMMCRQSAGA
jgi:hypothetical protein